MDTQALRATIAQIKSARLDSVNTVEYLAEALKQFANSVDLSSLEQCLDSKSLYRRQRLSDPHDDFHIVMALWKPYSSSPIHDHDETTGAVTTLSGTTIERKYEKAAPLGDYYFLEKGEVQVLDKTTVSPILPEHHGPHQLHAMHNPYATWAATLHVYMHPLKTFNLYNAQACELYTQTSEDLWFDEITAPLKIKKIPSLPARRSHQQHSFRQSAVAIAK